MKGNVNCYGSGLFGQDHKSNKHTHTHTHTHKRVKVIDHAIIQTN